MRRLPLLPIAPLLVVLIGLAAAPTLVALGVTQIRRTSDEEAQHRANVIAITMASRLRFTGIEDRGPLIAEVAQREDMEILLVTQEGRPVVNASFETFARDEAVKMLVDGEGVLETSSGRQRFASQPIGPPLEHLSLVVTVAAPASPPETVTLAQAVAALTALLIGVAAAVTFSYARAAHDEVAFVGKRIVAMADPDSDPAGQPVPIRAFDEVGMLTAAFNTLVDRFLAAEKSYRADLAEAARVDEERLAFLAGLSHELRTPLNAILGFSHVLESGVDGPLSTDTRESVEIIRTSGEHLRTLIDDILDLSALETGELKLSRRPLDLRLAVDEVVREATSLARHKGLVLRVEGASEVVALADRRRVRQILTNLVSNAVKFTPRGSVVVRVARRDVWAHIEVQDTGYGIAQSEQRAIFEAYRQATDTRFRQGGAGLGLATVKRLVELHGGAISVSSSIGEGSTFVLQLPLATEEDVLNTRDNRVSGTALDPEPGGRS